MQFVSVAYIVYFFKIYGTYLKAKFTPLLILASVI